MSYKLIKKILLIALLCFPVAIPSLAQNNMEAMRFLTVNALMQYGQKLYDRGDFNEASAVFNHVLSFDSHQPQALHYLHKMGHVPVLIPASPPKPVVAKLSIDRIDISDTENLKAAIEAKKEIIRKLRLQVVQMRADLASH